MKETIEGLVEQFICNNSEENDMRELTTLISLGIVVDADDPLEQGRLRVFCPSYNDDPKKLLHLQWAAYVSPVGGVIDQSSFARGHIAGTEGTTGPVHYGIWAIPEIGAHVLVACINGDSRRRVWMGCLPSHQETHTIGNGRYKHSGGTVDGPLSSTGNPIEPTYSKLKEAFNGEIGSSEWKTRGADYQSSAVRESPSPDKSVYIDDDLETISDNEEDSWVKAILGEHGYDWTGYKNLGAFLASRVQSWSTPGFHSISMDDRPFNSRMRFRTTAGNQILLDDTNERIYLSTSGGKSWVEMDAAGNVDIFAERRFSIHSEKDINFSAGESIRLKAGKFITMYAGTNGGQTPLTETVADGQIRIQASNDLHIMTEANLRIKAATDWHVEVGGNTHLDLTGTFNVESDGEMYIESQVNIVFQSSDDVEFNVVGKNTSVKNIVSENDAHVVKYNNHTHTQGNDNDGNIQVPTDTTNNTQDPIVDKIIASNPELDDDETKLAPWVNRKPQHEPWPRVLMQDTGDTVNSENAGYLDNVDWVEQYDNRGEDGKKPVGKTEGDEIIERGQFWRR